jgi:hypothetical protein
LALLDSILSSLGQIQLIEDTDVLPQEDKIESNNAKCSTDITITLF